MKKETKYKLSAILYGVLAIACCFSFSTLYLFVLIFAGLCAFNIYFAYKYHKKYEEHLSNKLKTEIDDYQDELKAKKKGKTISASDRLKKQNQRELKSLYERRLQQIEDDFSDVDFDKAMAEADTYQSYGQNYDTFFDGDVHDYIDED